VEAIRRCVDLGSTIPEALKSRVEPSAGPTEVVERSRPAGVNGSGGTAELSYVVTGSLIEAELLELDLIRHYQPELGGCVEEGREAVYLHIGRDHPFPVFEVSRKFPEGDRTGFGPFFDGEKLRRGLEVARRILRLRYCGSVFPPPDHARCVRHQKDHCAGPCRGTITSAVYRSRLERLVMFLRGDDDRLLEDMRRTYKTLKGEDVVTFDEGARNLLEVQRGLAEWCEPAQGAKLLVTSPHGEGGRATIVLFRRGRIVDRFRVRLGETRSDRLVRRMQTALLVHRADPVGLLRMEELAASEVVRRHISAPMAGERVYNVTNLAELGRLLEVALREGSRRGWVPVGVR